MLEYVRTQPRATCSRPSAPAASSRTRRSRKLAAALDAFAGVFAPTRQRGNPGRLKCPASRTSSGASAASRRRSRSRARCGWSRRAKLRRAQEAIEAAPAVRGAHARDAGGGRPARSATRSTRCWPRAPRARSVEILVVTSDRGLCGAFNANVLKRARRIAAPRSAAGATVTISTAGKKAREASSAARVRAGSPRTTRSRAGSSTARPPRSPTYLSRALHRRRGRRGDPRLQRVRLARSRRRRATCSCCRSSPARLASRRGDAAVHDRAGPGEARCAVLAPRRSRSTIFRALLENQAGEHAARMAAMESRHAQHRRPDRALTLQFNRARQAAITKELMEIVSGAEAL